MLYPIPDYNVLQEKESSLHCSTFLYCASDILAFAESGISIRKVNTLNNEFDSFLNAILFHFKCL